MTPTATFELVLALLAAVIALELLARRARLPPAAALIVGGIVLALLPGVPDLQLDPDLVLVLFLPPLLMAGAFFTVWRDFRRDLEKILQLAVGVVAFTTLAVGVVAHRVVPSLPWAACFALGAIVSPPDAVAARAVLQRLTLPRRMSVVLEGESLVNDASGLVLYRIAVVATLTGTFSAGQAFVSFGVVSAGGVAFGLACGFIANQLFKRLPRSELSIVASFLAAWSAYIGAQAIGASGVLATVACGLVLGARQHATLTAETRMRANAVWEVMVFVLESLVFILIGLSLRGVLERLQASGASLPQLAPPVLAIIAAVVVSRFVWIVPAVYVGRLFRPAGKATPFAIPVVLSWAGMRGVVSLAAALALPVGFPSRDFILATTFAVILVTVLVQGATLAPLIRALGLDRLPITADETLLPEAEARARMATAQLQAVQAASAQADGSHRHPRLFEQYSYRAAASARFSQAEVELAPRRHEHFTVMLAAVTAGRDEVLRLHDARQIHDDVLRALEQELDLEELTARRYLD